ncbi:MAG TPA: TonB-dependent receptor [Caulobacteraceae bacterium]|jgi:iron complex outermembrane receptor protein
MTSLPCIRSRRSLVVLTSAAFTFPVFLAAGAHAQAQAQTQAVQSSAQGGGAQTQAAQNAVSEVVVTARLRKEDVQKVPVSMSVASGEILDLQRIYTPRALQQVSANLNLTQANPRQTIPSIRGIGSTTQNSDGLDSAVGVYQDGVYLGRPGELAYNLLDIDQVEVLRGPQGTLYGRNTTGGSINISTVAPSFTYGAYAEASFGNYAFRQFDGAVTGPLINDVLAFRLTGYDTWQQGFEYNITRNVYENARDGYGGRLQLLFTPTANFSYRLIASYNREAAPQGAYSFLQDQPTSATGFNYTRSAALVAPGYSPPADPFNRIVDNDAREFSDTHQFLISGQGDWTFGRGYKLTSITAFQTWAFIPSNDADFTALPIAINTNYVDHVTQFSQELRVASPTGDRVEWVAGLYYFRQTVRGFADTTNQADAWAFNSALAPLANGTPARSAALSSVLNGFSYLTNETPETQSYAAYGQAVWHITRKWALTLGFRETYETKTQSILSSGEGNTQLLTCAGTGATCVFDGYALPRATAQKVAGAFPTGTANFSVDNLMPSGLASLSYQVRPDAMLYATYSHSEQSAGLNVGLLSSTVLAHGVTYAVAPEGADNYELGLKSQLLDRRLTLNLDAFWESISNYQTNAVFLINGAPTQALANAGGIRTRGFEMDASYTVTPNLQLRASGSYTDAQYTNYPNAPCAPEQTAEGLTSCSLTGREVANTPRYILNLAADYQHEISPKVIGYVSADYSFRSSQNLLTDDSRYGHIDGYGIGDIRIGVRISGRYDVSMWVQNITNTNYLTNIEETYGAFLGYLGDPRTFGVTLRVHM